MIPVTYSAYTSGNVGKGRRYTYICLHVSQVFFIFFLFFFIFFDVGAGATTPPPPVHVAEYKSHAYIYLHARLDTHATHTENCQILALLTTVHYLLGKLL